MVFDIVCTQHDNFAVVGMAVPDRIKLFRAQMGRAVGGNSRRTSHNPPDPVMLDIYDALGTMRGPIFKELAMFIGVFAH